MPLLIITGYPCAGKTSIATRIQTLLLDRIASLQLNLAVRLINDESLNLPKDAYRSAKSEKAARGAQLSAIKKLLSRDTIVIFDNLAYIKGFRYQLFCEAKAIRTNYCLLHVAAPPDICRSRNSLQSNPWPADLLDALIFRYEEPNSANRWDSPLFLVIHDEDHSSLPINDIWDSLVSQRPQRPNQATLLKAPTPTNYLYQLDKATQQIVAQLLVLQKDAPAASVAISNNVVHLPHTPVSVAQLQRIRRSYLALNKMKNVELDRIPVLFIEYLNKHFEAME